MEKLDINFKLSKFINPLKEVLILLMFICIKNVANIKKETKYLENYQYLMMVQVLEIFLTKYLEQEMKIIYILKLVINIDILL